MGNQLDTSLTPIIDRHRRDGRRLVQILREVQDQTGWLSPEVLSWIADAIAWPRARVESTAGFYSFFHTRPLGQYRILWSDNITDRMLGSQDLMQAMCRKLWLEPGRVSEDGLVSVEATSCTGLCDQGPAILVNYRAMPGITLERVDKIVHLVRNRVPLAEWPAEWFRIEDNIRRKDILLDHGLVPGEALSAALARGPETMLTEVRRANLRGRGGAGFGTALKWEACRQAEGSQRYLVCNADEGEPGTFKDRVLLNSYADLVFEGMTIAGHAIGATEGLLYLRGEYRYLLDDLAATLERRRREGLLGRNILGTPFNFDIEIHLGAGAYVCGEESALIESLEGKPGKPRIRPPFPVVRGYREQPTAVNNVETLASTCLIAARGGDWFAAIGTAKSAGSKLLSVSGDVEQPGIYEYPFGVTVAQVLADSGARNPQAVQISGAAGTCLADDEFERRIAFEDLPTAGSFMVFDRGRDMFEVARNFVHFFAHESCGFCTPCRVGTALNRRLMDKIAAGQGSPYDINEMFKLHRLMQGTSHCGLGNSATTALFDTLTKFKPAFERRLQSLDYEPGFDLDLALSQARQMTGRDDPGAHLSQEDKT
ncbi:NAD(P)H-dependent oxidoreductase subunit E [Denitratisoma oestradiolicum]|uniref:NAD-reducing hydrogenase HoxS subunit alpha n=1 Tax=Denitratisoma oestradiolicum TaxID=311182 RepID=A0A6S6XWV3_9PROT|nr:NAD(P)H-dependent oxidoreductase subunit E [Denitratisoma oestradiolicum]TWO78884.1 NADP oxidoreductase [Denitratisoma oestradiolicum]CAB1369434.1 NAD-reducing hydrogenase HoxS subunit alpha [Denitratisoma oestradiolicum]